MPTTACTDNYYATVITGYLPGTGETVGTIVTYTAPPAEWTDSDFAQAKQCNTVSLGGFNGLNS